MPTRSWLDHENKVVELFLLSPFHGDNIKSFSGKAAVYFITSWRRWNAQFYFLVPCFNVMNRMNSAAPDPSKFA